MVAAVLAWYITNYVMNLATFALFAYRDGAKVDWGRLDWTVFWSDRVGWALYFGRWPSLVIPGLIVLTLVCMRLELSWKLATWIGLALVAVQVVLMMMTRLKFHKPLVDPDYLIYYASRFWVDLAGVFAAAAIWKFDLGAEISSA